MFTISAFGDEIADDFETQLTILNDLAIPGLDLRGAWGKNVLQLDDDEAARAKQLCDEHEITVQCVGSPVGKSPLADPIQNELDNLARLYQIADLLGTRSIRIFSFYPDDRSTNDHYDQHVDEVSERLAAMADSAQRHGFLLLLENEKHIIGDTVDRCYQLMQGVDNKHLRFLWDPANFVQVGEHNVTEDGWEKLSPYLGYVHIKDYNLTDRKVTPAGDGDGQVPALLTKLRESGYNGVLSLEPHLKVAGHSSGFSGAGGMQLAVESLRKIMADTGCEEK